MFKTIWFYIEKLLTKILFHIKHYKFKIITWIIKGFENNDFKPNRDFVIINYDGNLLTIQNIKPKELCTNKLRLKDTSVLIVPRII